MIGPLNQLAYRYFSGVTRLSWRVASPSPQPSPPWGEGVDQYQALNFHITGQRSSESIHAPSTDTLFPATTASPFVKGGLRGISGNPLQTQDFSPLSPPSPQPSPARGERVLKHRDINYQGAWLTDVDDTLFKSGERPSDEQIRQLGEFVHVLKTHNIVWAPVSGVAIDKMGPRLLFRLPEDVLDHVIYYGGEGSSKHRFDPGSKTWQPDPAFERHFSTAQALAIIGPDRLRSALQQRTDATTSDQLLETQLDVATETLRACGFDADQCLIDELEAQLDEAGFDSTTAQTFFRGGAVSWMMLGDISVEHYKGERESRQRSILNDYLQQRLQQLDQLRVLGDGAVIMPYRHATRGIKLVLEGNDKARAAEDLIRMGIPAGAILFSGNELYRGGNDDSVRRIDGIVLLSVGEREDPGVIDGGIQTEALWQWMALMTTRLEQGENWRQLLQQLPALAQEQRYHRDIERFLAQCDADCPLSPEQLRKLSVEFLLALHLRHREAFTRARKCQEKLKKTEYTLVTRLASLKTWPYDHARKIVMELFDYSKQADRRRIVQQLKQFLLPEIKALLQQLLLDQTDLKPKKIRSRFRDIGAVDEMAEQLWSLIQASNPEDPQEEFDHAISIVNNWAYSLEEMIDHYFEKHARWCRKRLDLQRMIMTDAQLLTSFPEIDTASFHDFYLWLAPRLEYSPHFKDLDKPTIVLVAGTSGVGKSTISQHISLEMGIPTGFSSDVASRSVMRHSISFLLGEKKAHDTFPELFGSSFEKDSLQWFYTHAMLTMVGVIGSIDRLVKENISAVIDGVALIPGTLPEHYFESANIVWLIISVSDEQLHYERLATRGETGVQRGGSQRYQQHFAAIRHNHDHLVTMGRRARKLLIDNSGNLDEAIGQAVKRVADPFAERGLKIDDPLRDQVEKDLQERSTWEVQQALTSPAME